MNVEPDAPTPEFLNFLLFTPEPANGMTRTEIPAAPVSIPRVRTAAVT